MGMNMIQFHQLKSGQSWTTRMTKVISAPICQTIASGAANLFIYLSPLRDDFSLNDYVHSVHHEHPLIRWIW